MRRSDHRLYDPFPTRRSSDLESSRRFEADDAAHRAGETDRSGSDATLCDRADAGCHSCGGAAGGAACGMSVFPRIVGWAVEVIVGATVVSAFGSIGFADEEPSGFCEPLHDHSVVI